MVMESESVSRLGDKLYKRSGDLRAFDPPRDAEPSEIGDAQALPETDKPSVLNKLQKWADYPSVGEPVYPTKFLPMKTPMSLEIISNWSLDAPPKYSLTVPGLLNGEAMQGRRVGLIIDLANHECLYAEDIPSNLEYSHVQLIAKVLPPREAIDEVERVAHEFWTRCPDAFIAIHCAYGFNRTGFVVCSYLCQACGMTVDQALESFAAARPPGVKHGKFVDELYERYGSREESENTGPPTPSARRGLVSVGLGAAAIHDSVADGASIVRRRRPSEDAGSSSLPILSLGTGTGAGTGTGGVSDSKHDLRRITDAVEGGSIVGSPMASSNPIVIGGNNVSRSRRSSIGAGGTSTGGGADCDTTNPALNTSNCAASHDCDGVEGRSYHDINTGACNDFSTMAHHLNEKSQMRRETSLGLARALHEDFGQHDGTPQENEPSPIMQRVNSEAHGGSCGGDNNRRSYDARELQVQYEHKLESASEPTAQAPIGESSHRENHNHEHHDVTTPRELSHSPKEKEWHSMHSRHLSGLTPPSASPSHAPPAVGYRSQTTSQHQHGYGSSQRGGSMVRSISIDSDNQSLGFGHREALARLMEGPQAGTLHMRNFPGSNMSLRSDIHPGDWDPPEDGVARAAAETLSSSPEKLNTTKSRKGGGRGARSSSLDRKWQRDACSLM